MKNIQYIIRNETKKIINENNWNFHYTSKDNIDIKKKYSSDNKFQMIGRETGHFGSGTYFSTYQGMYDHKDVFNYLNKNTDKPELIKIDNHVYRVDFDIYKNLYKVDSKIEGDILYTLLSNVNSLFNMINYKDFEYISIAYQKILINSRALGLKCPKLRELINMAIEHEKSGNIQSFSTYFMEINGFNGVNVSGVDYYDNTKHGSVIYDLSKLGNNEIKLVKNIKGVTDKSSYNDTLATNGFFDNNPKIASLNGEFNVLNIKELNKLSNKDQMRCLKNYTLRGNVLDYYNIRMLNDTVLRTYMKYIFIKKPNGRFYNFDEIVERNMLLKIAYENNLYFCVNYIPNCSEYYSGLIFFLENNNSNIWLDYEDDNELNIAKKKYLYKIIKFLKRDLTNKEKNYIKNKYYL